MENPKIRFKGFTKDWEQRKLGDMGSTFTGLSGKTKEDFGHGDAQFITYMNVFSNPVANLEMTEAVEIDAKQNRVKKGDVFFTTSSETPEEVGMSCVMPENKDNIYLNSFCFGYRPTEKFDLDYLAYVLRADSFRKEMKFLAQGISRYNISKNKVMEVSIPIPNLEEQTMVGRYFSTLDHLITLHQRKCEQTKNLKKYMLQKMFPQNGAKVPEIRFNGFTHDWEQRKLGELGTVQTCKRIFKDQTSEKGDIPFFKNGTIGLEPDSYISREMYEEFRRLYPYPEVGDTLISVVGSIGRTAEYTGKDEYFQDSNVVWLKTDGSINKKFLKISYQVIKWLIEGSTVKHLYNDNILRSEIIMPVSQIEQAKIAEFFEELDHLITLHQRQTDFYKKPNFYFISS